MEKKRDVYQLESKFWLLLIGGSFLEFLNTALKARESPI
jgi:hypothetical protein